MAQGAGIAGVENGLFSGLPVRSQGHGQINPGGGVGSAGVGRTAPGGGTAATAGSQFNFPAGLQLDPALLAFLSSVGGFGGLQGLQNQFLGLGQGFGPVAPPVNTAVKEPFRDLR